MAPIYEVYFDVEGNLFSVEPDLVQFWGHPADLRYSAAPLCTVDPMFAPDQIPLDIPVDDSVREPSECRMEVHPDKLRFLAGNHEKWVEM